MQEIMPATVDAPVKRKRGRPRRTDESVQRWMSARGINPLHASEILKRCTDEHTTWKRILSDPDSRVVLAAMMFLVQMRDGKPAQQINVTSQSITISVDDIAKARAIVAELQSPSTCNPIKLQDNDDSKPLADTAVVSALMLSGDEGGKEGG